MCDGIFPERSQEVESLLGLFQQLRHVLQVWWALPLHSHCISTPVVGDVRTKSSSALTRVLGPASQLAYPCVAVSHSVVCSLSSSILFMRDLVLVRRRLGSGSICSLAVVFPEECEHICTKPQTQGKEGHWAAAIPLRATVCMAPWHCSVLAPAPMTGTPCLVQTWSWTGNPSLLSPVIKRLSYCCSAL